MWTYPDGNIHVLLSYYFGMDSRRESSEQEAFSVQCPFCGRGVYPRTLARHAKQEGTDYFIVQCSGTCKRVFFIVREQDYGATTRDPQMKAAYNYHVLPQHRLEPGQLDEAIPYDIRQDFAEASNCFHIEAFKAGVTMCRRTIENCLKDKGATKSRLIDQIDEVVRDEQLKTIAHSTRIIGNWGAHEQNDQLKNINIRTARGILELTWKIIDNLYVVPKKLSEIQGMIDGQEDGKDS
jgi:hypothetical protein